MDSTNTDTPHTDLTWSILVLKAANDSKQSCCIQLFITSALLQTHEEVSSLLYIHYSDWLIELWFSSHKKNKQKKQAADLTHTHTSRYTLCVSLLKVIAICLDTLWPPEWTKFSTTERRAHTTECAARIKDQSTPQCIKSHTSYQ